jgi:23S rRNA-/tRNA-specific pseudouridylate synthase
LISFNHAFASLREIFFAPIPRFHLGVEKWFHMRMAPCLIFEDEHLLVVHKPAGCRLN